MTEGKGRQQMRNSDVIVIQTFLSPGQGLLIDRFGPRALLSIGAILTGLSWMLAAQVSSVTGLYLTYGLLGGLGTGIIYIGVIGHMVRWFPDKRGLATGLVAAGYGMGAILFTFPVANILENSSYEQVLWRFGGIFAVIGFIAAQGLRQPSTDDVAKYTAQATGDPASQQARSHGRFRQVQNSQESPFLVSVKALDQLQIYNRGFIQFQIPAGFKKIQMGDVSQL